MTDTQAKNMRGHFIALTCTNSNMLYLRRLSWDFKEEQEIQNIKRTKKMEGKREREGERDGENIGRGLILTRKWKEIITIPIL